MGLFLFLFTAAVGSLQSQLIGHLVQEGFQTPGLKALLLYSHNSLHTGLSELLYPLSSLQSEFLGLKTFIFVLQLTQ